MGVSTVEGFYFRMPPYGYLLMVSGTKTTSYPAPSPIRSFQVHLAVAIRAAVLAKFGSVNTRASADIMDTAGMSAG